MLTHFLLDSVRVALLISLALATMPLLRRSAASARRLVLALALGGALVLPAVSAVVPAWRIDAPVAMTSLRGVVLAEGPVTEEPSVAGVTPETEGVARPRVEAPAWSIAPAQGVAMVWALGALLVLARLAFGLARSRAVVKRAKPARSWGAAAIRAEAVTGTRAIVLATDDLDAPAVTGILGPVILVPRGSESWSEARRHAVLLHELAHVRQRDCLAQIVAQLACAMNWFDPMVWIAARRLRLERELAADDAVIAAGTRASSYAEDLLAIAGVTGALRPTPSSALGMAEGSQLVRRVAALVSAERSGRGLSRSQAGWVASGAAAVTLIVACSTPAPAKSGSSAVTAAPVAGLESVAAEGSSINPRLQAIADEEIDRLAAEWQPRKATVLILDPSTGEILANAGRAGGARSDVAVKDAFITGSTLKAVTLAAALEEGVVSPGDRFDCEHGAWTYQGKVIHDWSPFGTLTLPEMLAVSSNVGFSKVFDRLGGERLGRWLRAFHFGAAPAIDGANAGEMPSRIEEKSYASAVLAIGEGMSASPLQVAAAYATIANGGAYVAPTLMHRTGSAPREQILKPETAHTLATMLGEVVQSEQGTGKLARVPGQRVSGKTGTAAWDLPDGGEGVYSSFVGFVPSAAPRFVILVGAEQPRDGEGGGKVAAPVFARVASRALGD